MTLLHSLRLGLRRLGFDLRRYPDGTAEDRRARLLQHFGITVVLDVGANEGQFASELRRLGYVDTIVSFEPLTQAASRLSQHAARDPKWIVVPGAVGDTHGTAMLNIAKNSVSSSLLPILPRHVEAAPGSRYVGTEEVKIMPLADAARPFLTAADRVFLKIDAQGFQRQIVSGAKGIWELIIGLQVEFSLVPLYEGEMLLPEGLAQLGDQGFALMGVEPGFTDPRTGRTLQVDALLFRE